MPRPTAIPDRWIPYKACGNVIEGTRFICFKVPLRKIVQKQNPEIKEIWDIKALLEKIPKLGAVIDLTNTSRYYNPKDLTDVGILHKKILMPGRFIPPESIVTEFMNTVDEFLGKDCDFIGVHCTHGLNRTGYMVCRYMRDRLGISARIAIKRFEKARGYKIERKNYIADLLGLKPPPPDVGQHTEVKPLQQDRRSNMNYISPLGYDDEEEYQVSRRYTRNNSGQATNFNTGGKRKADTSRSDYDKRKRPKSGDDVPNTSKSYDYKYDY